MSQENTNQPPTTEAPVVATPEPQPASVEKKPHEIKMAESYLDEKLKEFFQGKDETNVKPIPGSMVLNFVSEDSTPTSILDAKSVANTANPETAASNATDLNGTEPKTSVRTKEHEGGHPVNINTICLFACKTVEEFNKASNLMLSGVEKLNMARDIVDKVIDKVAVFVPENQRREFSKNIHHGLNRVEEIIEFIVEISRFPNWVNAEKWIMNTLEDLKPRCRFIPCIDRDLKKKIAKRQKESQDLLDAEKKAAKEEKARVDKMVAAEKAEADKKAKEELKVKKAADEAEAKAKKEAEKEEKRKQKEAEEAEAKAKKEAEKEQKRKEKEEKKAKKDDTIEKTEEKPAEETATPEAVVVEEVKQEEPAKDTPEQTNDEVIETKVETTESEKAEPKKELTESEKMKEEIRKMQQALADKEKEEKRLEKERKAEEKRQKEEDRKRKEEEIKKLKEELKKL